MTDSHFTESSEGIPPERASWPIWPWLALLAGLIGVIVWRGMAGSSVDEPKSGQRHPAVGAKLNELALAPLTGDPAPVTLADLKGKVTLINFWGPWCGPCAMEFPHLVEIEQHFRDRSHFQFLSVSSNPDPRDDQGLAETTREFLKQQRAQFPTYRDPRGRTTLALIEAARLEGFGYPTTVLLDSQGIIRGLWIGYRPGDERQVRAAIEDALESIQSSGPSESN